MPVQTIDELLKALRNRPIGLAAAELAQLRSTLAELLATLVSPLRAELTSFPDAAQVSASDARAELMAHLAWIESIRSSIITPLEEAAIEGRACAIRAGMGGGLPGSAFVEPTGLTLARIYQIRDGRR